MKTDQELTQAGYTQAGLQRYRDTLEAYAGSLFEKSVTFAEADKDPAPGATLDVTADHVRKGATNLSMSFGRDRPSPWSLPVQIFEYVCTALAGVGGGSLKESWGIPLFGISLVVGVALFVFRNISLNR